MRRSLPVSLLLTFLICPSILAQEETSGVEMLTNEKVITMTKAGLPSSVVVNKIRTSKTNFNTSTDDLIRLKQEKVPDEVINALLTPAAALPPGAVTQASGAATLGKMYTFGVAPVK